MNKSSEENLDDNPLILTGIRDNLLKPMADEICSKNEKQIKSLRILLLVSIGIAALSIIADVAVAIMLCCK